MLVLNLLPGRNVYAGCPLLSYVNMPTEQTDRLIDGRTPDRDITLSATDAVSVISNNSKESCSQYNAFAHTYTIADSPLGTAPSSDKTADELFNEYDQVLTALANSYAPSRTVQVLKDPTTLTVVRFRVSFYSSKLTTS